MKIISKPFFAWSTLIQKNLCYSTFGDQGLMKIIIKRYRQVETYVAFNNKQVMGWALIGSANNNPIIMIHVNKRYRYKGVATAIAKYINKRNTNKIFCAFPHDKKSRNFYSKLNNEVLMIDYQHCGDIVRNWSCEY